MPFMRKIKAMSVTLAATSNALVFTRECVMRYSVTAQSLLGLWSVKTTCVTVQLLSMRYHCSVSRTAFLPGDFCVSRRPFCINGLIFSK